jgi:hypothetical protein
MARCSMLIQAWPGRVSRQARSSISGNPRRVVLPAKGDRASRRLTDVAVLAEPRQQYALIKDQDVAPAKPSNGVLHDFEVPFARSSLSGWRAGSRPRGQQPPFSAAMVERLIANVKGLAAGLHRDGPAPAVAVSARAQHRLVQRYAEAGRAVRGDRPANGPRLVREEAPEELVLVGQGAIGWRWQILEVGRRVARD